MFLPGSCSQLPELSVEQLAELEEQMTEEHFNFLLNMMDDIKYASTVSYFHSIPMSDLL